MTFARPHIALRADASIAIGLGHVKRCLALATALRAAGADALLLTRELGLDIKALAQAAGVEYLSLSTPQSKFTAEDDVPHAAWAGTSWQVDATQCSEALECWRPDWVVVDHYAFDSRWHDLVAARLGTRIAAIDDLADRNLRPELLVDPNLSEDHREKYARRAPLRTTILGGPRFALLGPKYAMARRVSLAETVSSVGIFMGGVDAANLSCLALRACRDVARFDGRVEIVVTRAYPHTRSLEALAKESKETRVTYDLPDLAEFLAGHDLQIGAGGGASWERCCLGAPTLALRAAANQDAVLPALARLGAVALVGGEGVPDEISVGRELRALLDDPMRRRLLSQRGRDLVDGLGAKRVALRLMAQHLSVRRATLSDAEMMYEWRNHPDTRSVSLNRGEISRAEHESWLSATLQAPARRLWIGRVGNEDVGVIRFDIDGDLAEVSLYLDPAMHGLGLGRALLLAGEAAMLNGETPVIRFVARILESNTASLRLFTSCGYNLRDGQWQKSAYERVEVRWLA